MEVIAELEPHRRGLYTGGFGAVFDDGGAKLGMAIRTLTRRGDVGHYFAGGGIVADSRPEFEVEETLWKAAQLERVSTPPTPDRPDIPVELPLPGGLGSASRAGNDIRPGTPGRLEGDATRRN